MASFLMIRLCRADCMMRAVTAFLSLLMACGDDVQFENPAVDVDVVTVGAGWNGMAAADHLDKAGVSFVVLEIQRHMGGRSHAFMLGHESVGQYVLVRIGCVDVARRRKTRIRRRFAPTACFTWQRRRVSKLLTSLAHVMATCRITS